MKTGQACNNYSCKYPRIAECMGVTVFVVFTFVHVKERIAFGSVQFPVNIVFELRFLRKKLDQSHPTCSLLPASSTESINLQCLHQSMYLSTQCILSCLDAYADFDDNKTAIGVKTF